MRKIKIASLTLVFCLVFGTISSFAAAWQTSPENPNDPCVTVTYKQTDDGYEMTMTGSRISEGLLDLNGTAYDIKGIYKVHKRIDDHNLFVGWATSGNKLYQARIIGETSPGIAEDDTDNHYARPGDVWTVTYDLIRTNKRPANSDVTDKKIHKVNKNKIVRSYYIKGKKVSRSAYKSAAESGKYTASKTKKISKKRTVLIKTKKIFSGIASVDDPSYYEMTSEGIAFSDYDSPYKLTYYFTLHRYYKVSREYKIIYKLK